jgi:hypothetical protein
LRLLLRDLSVQPAGPVLAALAEPHRAQAAALFEGMRSGSGFSADLRNFTDITGYRETAADVGQAALVIASPADGAAAGFGSQQVVTGLSGVLAPLHGILDNTVESTRGRSERDLWRRRVQPPLAVRDPRTGSRACGQDPPRQPGASLRAEPGSPLGWSLTSPTARR